MPHRPAGHPLPDTERARLASPLCLAKPYFRKRVRVSFGFGHETFSGFAANAPPAFPISPVWAGPSSLWPGPSNLAGHRDGWPCPRPRRQACHLQGRCPGGQTRRRRRARRLILQPSDTAQQGRRAPPASNGARPDSLRITGRAPTPTIGRPGASSRFALTSRNTSDAVRQGHAEPESAPDLSAHQIPFRRHRHSEGTGANHGEATPGVRAGAVWKAGACRRAPTAGLGLHPPPTRCGIGPVDEIGINSTWEKRDGRDGAGGAP